MTDETSNASPRKCKDARRDQTTAAVIDLLCEVFPATFQLYEERRWPLKIGIHHDILAQLDGVITPVELSRALRAYVANRIYRSRLKDGVQRRDLDGKSAGIVTADQAVHLPVKTAKTAAKAVDSPVMPESPKRITLTDLRAAAAKRRAEAGRG